MDRPCSGPGPLLNTPAAALAALAMFVTSPPWEPACLAFAQGPPAHPHGARPVPKAELSDTARVRRWGEDLKFITHQVRTVHPRPFFRGSEAAFDSAARAIEARIATTDDARLAVECMRMVALLGDGHTMVIGTLPPLGFTSVLPVFLRPFEDGLHVIAADAANAGAVGARVARIGDVTAAEALERVASATSGDNRYTRLERAPLFLMMPALLHALGISASPEQVTLETVTTRGDRQTLTVTAGAPPGGFPFAFLATEPAFPSDWTSARRLPASGAPRCDRRPDEAWWYEDLADSRALYLRIARVEPIVAPRANPENYRHFYHRLFAHADSMRPASLIIDLRHNHGGNNVVVDLLIRGIVERPWLNREGALFALVDRGTFSAAMNAAVFLEDRTRVTFVGEPTGGGPNHYGDAVEGATPNLGMMCHVSTLPWLSRFPQDARPWIAPDIAAPATFAGWRDGRDEALEAALDAVRNGTRDQRVLAAAQRGGPAGAVAAFAEWNRLHPNPWGGDPGRSLAASVSARMDDGAWGDAATLGEALVRFDSKSAFAWRVAGEAHLNAGHRDRGVQCLREALRLDPQARFARMVLRQLGEEP